MTVIAYRNGILAADKLVCYGMSKQTVTKIFRIGKELVGFAGDLATGMEVLGWYKAGAVLADWPASARGEDSATFLVVRKSGTVICYEATPYPYIVEGEFCAFGCGDESALVAMDCGKTAREAVEIVCKYNSGCGNGIDVLKL